MNPAPVVGILGVAGAYGRWLERFFRTRMGLSVLGFDPALADCPAPEHLARACDVLVFSVPIRHSAGIIRALAREMRPRQPPPLWLDVTSIKQAPIEAMLEAPVEVLGLHPMTAPPKSDTLKGRVLVVCEGRLDRWRGFVDRLLAALEAQCVHCAPHEHDRIMARVQGSTHAALLTLAAVLGEERPAPPALMPFRTPVFELVHACMARLLSGNPAIYEDIQFSGAETARLLRRLAARTAELAAMVDQGDEAARQRFRQRFLDASARAFGEPGLAEAHASFERLAWLLADLAEPRCVILHLPHDRPGALRRVLAEFERDGIDIESIHSSRDLLGEVQFRIGFSRQQPDPAVREAATRIHRLGLAVLRELHL
ncbi:MAG: prephenate dehydrogenase [Lysobacteraceae bacterium]|nr:MAG: prephenate dehydrogenase [Xanthomonadaceae bacterium]